MFKIGYLDEFKEFCQSQIDEISSEHCTKCELKEYYLYSSDSKCRECEHGKKILEFLKGLHDDFYF